MGEVRSSGQGPKMGLVALQGPRAFHSPSRLRGHREPQEGAGPASTLTSDSQPADREKRTSAVQAQHSRNWREKPSAHQEAAGARGACGTMATSRDAQPRAEFLLNNQSSLWRSISEPSKSQPIPRQTTQRLLKIHCTDAKIK